MVRPDLSDRFRVHNHGRERPHQNPSRSGIGWKRSRIGALRLIPISFPAFSFRCRKADTKEHLSTA